MTETIVGHFHTATLFYDRSLEYFRVQKSRFRDIICGDLPVRTLTAWCSATEYAKTLSRADPRASPGDCSKMRFVIFRGPVSINLQNSTRHTLHGKISQKLSKKLKYDLDCLGVGFNGKLSDVMWMNLQSGGPKSFDENPLGLRGSDAFFEFPITV
jgi:hypothetical protein